MKKFVLWLLFMAFLSISGCGGSSSPKPAAAADQSETGNLFVAQDAKGIRTITVQPTTIPDYMEIPGRIVSDPTRVVHVYPAAGGRVVEMKVRPWDRVQQGQTLALLESSDLSRAMADYQKARTDAALKKKALDRSSDLLAHHAMAEKDAEQAEADAQSAEAEEKTALDRLHLLGADPAATSNQLRVIAPRSGVILDIGNAQGELSKSLDAAQPLCTIADLDTVWVEGEIFEKDLAGLKPGTPVSIAFGAYPDEKRTGRVSVIGDAVDSVTRTLKVRIVLSNPGLRLKPDMFATIRLLRSSTQGILVPAAAVERDGLAAYVFVGVADNRFERRQVVLGRTVDESLEVTSGLTAGNVIVSEGVVLLRAASQD
jgi:cobalt-zinc-cadmium efflux system membrane fusion protein